MYGQLHDGFESVAVGYGQKGVPWEPTTTVLVTGATGTIGSGLITELQAAGVRVRALVRDAAKAAALQAQGVRTVEFLNKPKE